MWEEVKLVCKIDTLIGCNFFFFHLIQRLWNMLAQLPLCRWEKLCPRSLRIWIHILIVFHWGSVQESHRMWQHYYYYYWITLMWQFIVISSHPLLTGLSDRNKHTQATAHLITSHCPIYFLVSVIYLMTRSPVFLPQLKVILQIAISTRKQEQTKSLWQCYC